MKYLPNSVVFLAAKWVSVKLTTLFSDSRNAVFVHVGVVFVTSASGLVLLHVAQTQSDRIPMERTVATVCIYRSHCEHNISVSLAHSHKQ